MPSQRQPHMAIGQTSYPWHSGSGSEKSIAVCIISPSFFHQHQRPDLDFFGPIRRLMPNGCHRLFSAIRHALGPVIQPQRPACFAVSSRRRMAASAGRQVVKQGFMRWRHVQSTSWPREAAMRSSLVILHPIAPPLRPRCPDRSCFSPSTCQALAAFCVSGRLVLTQCLWE